MRSVTFGAVIPMMGKDHVVRNVAKALQEAAQKQGLKMHTTTVYQQMMGSEPVAPGTEWVTATNPATGQEERFEVLERYVMAEGLVVYTGADADRFERFQADERAFYRKQDQILDEAAAEAGERPEYPEQPTAASTDAYRKAEEAYSQKLHALLQQKGYETIPSPAQQYPQYLPPAMYQDYRSHNAAETIEEALAQGKLDLAQDGVVYLGGPVPYPFTDVNPDDYDDSYGYA